MSMSLNDVRRIVQEARDEFRIPNLRGVDLRGVDLRGVDLRGVDLRGVDLRGVDLRGVDLYGVDLYGAKLYGAKLYGADLRGADLYGANLYGAKLYGADLRGANLYGVDGWDGLQITGLHRYQILLIPTHEGWSITIGCWTGTPDDLMTLIAQDDGWPESEGEEIPRNRALLEAALTVIRAHIDNHPDAVDNAIAAHKEWEAKNTERNHE